MNNQGLLGWKPWASAQGARASVRANSGWKPWASAQGARASVLANSGWKPPTLVGGATPSGVAKTGTQEIWALAQGFSLSSSKTSRHFPSTFILILLVFFSPSAFAQGRAECRSAPSKILGRAVPYCVILPPSYDSQSAQRYPVLYWLHGLGGDSQMLINSGGLDVIEDLWQQKQISEFLIVTPDAGRSFYVNSRDAKVRYQDFFIREFIPYIESHYRIRASRQNRGISGVSMGGYGALRFAFLYPNLFGAVSAHSPALVEKSPLAGMSDGQAMGISMFLGSAFGAPFDPAYWRQESPFTIVRDSPNLGLLQKGDLKIYFDCGTSDSYGFNRGAQAFHDLLISRKIPHEFHLYPGSHDWSYFASHLPASLQFHSHSFASPH